MIGRLLCVTQDPQAKRPLVDSLQMYGYEVDVATDRYGALSLSEQQSYDIALLDELVEQDNGIEIYRDIERLQDHLDGILCCHAPTVDRVDSAMAAGMNHVIAKPVKTGEVMSLITSETCESSRSYNDRFPHGLRGFEGEVGMIKGQWEGECETCGFPTQWYHATKHLYFCCEDCWMRFQSLTEV